jgi:hypothetical protein
LFGSKKCKEQINPLNAELNPICHLLALLGAHLIFHFNRIRVNSVFQECKDKGKQGVSEGILLVTNGKIYELDSLLKNSQLSESYRSVNCRAEQMLDCLEENSQQELRSGRGRTSRKETRRRKEVTRTEINFGNKPSMN